MSKVNVQINGYYNVKSNRILSRRVVNDANVTDWEVITGIDDYEQSEEGLKRWMHVENLFIGREPDRWDTEKLERGIAYARDPHVYDYGQRLQFWIPLAEDRDEEPEKLLELGFVVCVNASGREQLTEGREYTIIKVENDLIIIIDDSGKQEKYFSDRFRLSYGIKEESYCEVSKVSE